MPTIDDVACATFTFQCPWGCTVQVQDGQEQPHTCAGASLLVDAMRVTDATGLTVLEYAERLAALLVPEVRLLRGASWETGVREGRSGQTFIGIDMEV